MKLWNFLAEEFFSWKGSIFFPVLTQVFESNDKESFPQLSLSNFNKGSMIGLWFTILQAHHLQRNNNNNRNNNSKKKLQKLKQDFIMGNKVSIFERMFWKVRSFSIGYNFVRKTVQLFGTVGITNDGWKLWSKVGKATEGVRNRMSFRQRRMNDDSATEYTDAYIQNKFQKIPSLTFDEKDVIRSSWQIIQRKMDKVKYSLHQARKAP